MFEWFDGHETTGRSGVFLDRDGVINEHIAGGYVLNGTDFKWLPGVVAAMRKITESGRALFIVTNQSCINRGLVSVESVTTIMNEMVRTLDAAGVHCSGWLCCPHRPDEGCACRKPGSAMLERAIEVTGVSLQGSVLIGDSLSDIEAARRAGIPGFLIDRNAPHALTAAVDHLMGLAA